MAAVQEDVAEMKKAAQIINRQAHSATRVSLMQMPPKLPNLFGRDAFVAEIVDELTRSSESSGFPRICVHSPGGMGKKSVALAVAEDDKVMNTFGENGRFWVPCISATSPDLLLQLLYTNLRISLDTGNYLRDIIAELRSSSSPRLILLDNFETAWFPIEGTRDDVENILRQLSLVMHVGILVTMRANLPPAREINWVDKELRAVDKEHSIEIYCTIQPEARGEPKLDELLDALGHMPFAIKLISTLGNETESMPNTLLEAWEKDGPGMIPGRIIERSIELSLNIRL